MAISLFFFRKFKAQKILLYTYIYIYVKKKKKKITQPPQTRRPLTFSNERSNFDTLSADGMTISAFSNGRPLP